MPNLDANDSYYSFVAVVAVASIAGLSLWELGKWLWSFL